MKVVIAGGGTAGHVFPALALAEKLRPDAEIEFVGSPDGQEASLVPDAGYMFHGVAADRFPRKLSPAAATAGFKALRSVGACREIVRAADVVVGMGGYASVPAVLAARLGRRPLLLHEQNAIPGLANRLAARWARVVAVSFEGSAVKLPRARKLIVTGNPVRASILEALEHRERLRKEALDAFAFDPDRRTVVVFGGSQGALSLDRAVAGAIELLADRQDIQLLALTGPSHLDVVAVPARTAGRLRVCVLGSLDRIELALAAADLAVARAGAGHIAELSVCGVPAILVPYPYATDDHQAANGLELETAGAATVMPDRELTPETFASRVSELLADPSRLEEMASSMRRWSKPDAAERLASLVREVAS